jgi:hypothetical protein
VFPDCLRGAEIGWPALVIYKLDSNQNYYSSSSSAALLLSIQVLDRPFGLELNDTMYMSLKNEPVPEMKILRQKSKLLHVGFNITSEDRSV